MLGEDEMDVPTTGDQFHRFKINFTEADKENTNVAKIDHIICVRCIDRVLKVDSGNNIKTIKMNNNESDRGSKNNTSARSKVLSCKICDEDHTIDIREWNLMFKKTCCAECNIF